VLLARADDLGNLLLPAFNTSSGLPVYAVNTRRWVHTRLATLLLISPIPFSGDTRSGWTQNVLLAEALSCQLEFKYLAHMTGRTAYYHKVSPSLVAKMRITDSQQLQVENVMDKMAHANISQGLLPTMWDATLATPKNGACPCRAIPL
jgi:mannosyl-oligosaccharide alpha-1,2-mannosidase